MTDKALIYCRVSSKKQVTDGDGLGSQEFRCIKFAAERGLEVEKVFHEEGVTGRGDFTARPTMQRLLKYLDENPTKNYYIIFDDLKRFARDTMFHFKLKTELESRGATPLCPNFKFENTPEGLFIETLYAAFGQLESSQNRRQAIQRMEARLQRGYWVFRHVPSGYTYISDPVHKRILSPVYPEARIIKKAIEGFADGRFQTKSDVLRFLQKNPLKSKGKILVNDLKLVNRILDNILYTGYIEYPKWKIPRTKGHHRAIITPETFELVQQRLKENAPKARYTQSDDFPLRQIVQCSYCEKGYTSSTVKGRSSYYPYYACYNSACKCPLKNIQKKALEEEYYNFLKGIQPPEEMVRLLIEEMKREYAPKQVKLDSAIGVQKRVIDAKMREIDDLLFRASKAKTEMIISRYEAQAEELGDEVEVLKKALKGMKSPKIERALELGGSFIRTASESWKNGDNATKIAIHRMVFPHSLYYDTKTGFRTAAKSLPFSVFDHFKGGGNALADIKGNYSNQFISDILSWMPTLEIIFGHVLTICLSRTLPPVLTEDVKPRTELRANSKRNETARIHQSFSVRRFLSCTL